MMAGKEEIRNVYEGYMKMQRVKYSQATTSLIEAALKMPVDVNGIMLPLNTTANANPFDMPKFGS